MNYECFVLSVCACVHLFIKYLLFYCTSGHLSLLWCSCEYFFIIRVLPPSFCPSVRVSMGWFSPALVPDAVQVWGSCSRLPPRCSSLCPAPVAQPIPSSTALCHPHPVGNLSPTQTWHWQHTPLSLILFHTLFLLCSPLLSCLPPGHSSVH